MKLRNLMYATMIACAFASCSKDEVIDNGPDQPTKGDASFSIGVSTPKSTKAVIGEGETIGSGIESEDAIKSLTLVLFNSTGNYLASATADIKEGGDAEVSIGGLVPQTVSFMVLANMDISQSTLAGLTSTTIMNQAVVLPEAGFTKDSEKGLPMSSAVISPIELNSGDNYYGYAEEKVGATNHSVGTPLPLVRNVSRVDLCGVNLAMKHSDYTSGTAKFQFTGVKIKNAAGSALIEGADASNTTFISGDESHNFYKETPASELEAATQTNFSTDVAVEHVSAYFYVLANTQEGENVTPTQLVVDGNFTLIDGFNENTKVKESFSGAGSYPITVGVTGVKGGSVGLVNNKIYKITLYVAGPGESTTGGKKANFSVNTEVEDWEAVNQGAIIK